MAEREIHQGDLYWLAVGESGGSLPAIAHPHLVLQEDVFNRSRLTTVIVCALTTNLRRGTEPGNVLLAPGEGGLPKPSVIVVSQLASIERARLGGYIGTLDQQRVEQALDGLRFQQASFFSRSRTP